MFSYTHVHRQNIFQEGVNQTRAKHTGIMYQWQMRETKISKFFNSLWSNWMSEHGRVCMGAVCASEKFRYFIGDIIIFKFQEGAALLPYATRAHAYTMWKCQIIYYSRGVKMLSSKRWLASKLFSVNTWRKYSTWEQRVPQYDTAHTWHVQPDTYRTSLPSNARLHHSDITSESTNNHTLRKTWHKYARVQRV